MKRLTQLLIIAGGLSLASTAQAQLHQAGQSALEVSVGVVDGFRLPRQDQAGYFAGVAYSKYRSRYSYWKIGAQLSQKSYAYDAARVPLSQWIGQADYFTRVLGRVSRSYVINVGIGVAGGYESINEDQRVFEGAQLINRSNWIVGPAASIEAEYLASGRVILLARVKEHYFFRSSVARTRFTAGIGLKIVIPSNQERE